MKALMQKHAAKKTTNLPAHQDKDLVALALKEVEARWEQMTHEQYEDYETLIGLPHPYIVPTTQAREGFVFHELYYWDTYFVIEDFVDRGRVEMAKGMVEDFLTMVERFGVIPNSSRYYMLSRSQIPFLTSMILKVYEKTKDKDWLRKSMLLAEREYRNVWISEMHPHNRRVFNGLSRYYEINMLDDLAEAESGWDYTTRFDDRCLDFIPIDLNANLYKYEQDFATMADIFDDAELAQAWRERAEARRAAVDMHLWSEKAGMYFDYDYANGKQGKICSLATYMPMFLGMASKEQAEKLVKNLDRFLTEHGLSTTALDEPIAARHQWANPNGWAPLQFIVVRGLEKYGYHELAKDIALRWVSTNLRVFNYTGELFEKYNVVNPLEEPVEGVYPSQVGFGWTNAVLENFIHDYCLGDSEIAKAHKK